MDAKKYEPFRNEIVEAIWRDVAPLSAEIEETETIPREQLWPLLHKMGAFGLLIPPEYGGHGLTITQYVPIIAEFAKAHGGVRALIHVHNSMGHAFWQFATARQRELVLPQVATGRSSVAFALTEPEHGTGVDTGTTARRVGDEYVVNGSKWLITNSDFATHFMVFVKMLDASGAEALSLLLIERGTQGFAIEPLAETMGCKGGEHGRLTFEDVRVPVVNLLGAEGAGVESMEKALEISRVLVAASSLGTAEYALELSTRFARERVTFGKAIASRQAVQRYLAEMATDVYALRLLLADAATKWDAGARIPLEASACKLFGLEAVGRVTDRALLVHGGIGYTREHEIERLYRDARLNWFEEGTPTIQQLVIARELLENGLPEIVQLG